MLFENCYDAILHWIETKLQFKNWILRLTIGVSLLSVFLAFPSYNVLVDHIYHQSGQLDAWVFIENQARDLLHPDDIGYGVYTRRNAMIYRWTLPVLYNLTGQSIVLVLLLQVAAGTAFIYLVARETYAITSDKIATFLFTLSLSQIFIGAWAFVDIYGYGDTFAYFFILSAMLTRNRLALFLLLGAAFLTDERAVVAGGYVLLWWILRKAFESGNFTFGQILRNAFASPGWIVWLTWVAYFTMRIYLGKTYFPNHRYTYDWAPVLLRDSNRYGFGSSIWSVFEGMWLILLAAALALVLTKRYALLTALAFGVLILISTGIYVHDIDRALSYGFPFLLMATLILSKSISLKSMRTIFFFSAVICLIHPLVLTMGFNRIIWIEPLPLRVLMSLDRLWNWNLFN
jgi:hypothetical protein